MYDFWLDINWTKTIGWLSLLSHFHFSRNSENILKFLLRLNGSYFNWICNIPYILYRCLLVKDCIICRMSMNEPSREYLYPCISKKISTYKFWRHRAQAKSYNTANNFPFMYSEKRFSQASLLVSTKSFRKRVIMFCLELFIL